jgi:hypothetical protein
MGDATAGTGGDAALEEGAEGWPGPRAPPDVVMATYPDRGRPRRELLSAAGVRASGAQQPRVDCASRRVRHQIGDAVDQQAG